MKRNFVWMFILALAGIAITSSFLPENSEKFPISLKIGVQNMKVETWQSFRASPLKKSHSADLIFVDQFRFDEFEAMFERKETSTFHHLVLKKKLSKI